MPPRDVLRLSVVLPTSAERLYRAWLDPKEHAAFTGAPATSTGKSGGKFTAWDGYISGKYLELEPPGEAETGASARIVASWRTSDFAAEAPDSRVELLFQPASGGTRVTLLHSDLPPGDGVRYREGWERFYFEPMRGHFRAPVPARGSESKLHVADEKRTSSAKGAARARPPASRPPGSRPPRKT